MRRIWSRGILPVAMHRGHCSACPAVPFGGIKCQLGTRPSMIRHLRRRGYNELRQTGPTGIETCGSSKILALLAIGLAFALSACGAREAARQEASSKQQVFEHRVDMAHIWVTTEAPGAGKPFTELGQLTIHRAVLRPTRSTKRRSATAERRWRSRNGPTRLTRSSTRIRQLRPTARRITVTAKAIKYDSSVDREAFASYERGEWFASRIVSSGSAIELD